MLRTNKRTKLFSHMSPTKDGEDKEDAGIREIQENAVQMLRHEQDSKARWVKYLRRNFKAKTSLPSFMNLPRELRDMIYKLSFNDLQPSRPPPKLHFDPVEPGFLRVDQPSARTLSRLKPK